SVNVNEGILEIGSGAQSGAFSIANGATLRFNQQSPLFNSGSNFSGAGTLDFLVNAALPGPNTFSGTTTVGASLELRHPLALQNSSVQLIGGSLGLQGLMTAKLSGLQMDNASTLNFEFGGSSSNGYDRLNISGTTSLNGALHVSLVDGFVPAEGNTFDIL